MSKFIALGPEPCVAPGDHAAARQRAHQIGEYLSSMAYKKILTKSERCGLMRMRRKWLIRAAGKSAFFEKYGNEPRALRLLDFRLPGGANRQRQKQKDLASLEKLLGD